MKNIYKCEYCDVKVKVYDNDICCPECGLVYVLKYNSNKGINYIEEAKY